jgi:hypothetical protein
VTDPLPNMPRLGAEGDACSACQAPLAADQRYCLQCGKRRGASRVDFAELLPLEPATPGVGGATQVDSRVAPQSPWTPFALVGSIATLGLMVLVGVMIGKDDSPTQLTAAAPVAPVASAAAEPASTGGGTGATTAGKDAGGGGKSTSKDASDKGGGGGAAKQPVTAPASEAQGAETVDDGALEALDNATGQDAADASKNLPDTIALPGEPPPVDNEAPGGGGSAQVIK